MRKGTRVRLFSMLALLGMSFITRGAQAQTFNTIHNFTAPYNGMGPDSTLVMDTQGNLYGMTLYGGNTTCFQGCGTVFQLSKVQGGGWKSTTIYRFQGGSDGFYPVPGSRLLMDAAGNLFGETVGSDTTNCPSPGCGTIFELSPNGSGGWEKSTVYSFHGSDGSAPRGGLAMDAAGNLYGVTEGGGDACSRSSDGCGVVFELSPQSDGTWTEAILHQFDSDSDGYDPQGVVLADGNLFGTTECSPNTTGCDDGGTVFELIQDQTTGTWTESILHVFQRFDGELPNGAPAVDAKGALYGSTAGGGAGDHGVIYKMIPQAGGGWLFRLIHAFSKFEDGLIVSAPVTLDAAGNVYGTTEKGGNRVAACQNVEGPGCGVVYKLVRPTSGPWVYQVLYSFSANGDGNSPQAGVSLDSQGNVFGTTGLTGSAPGGTVFKIRQ